MAVAYKRAVEGQETIIIRRGQEVERRIRPSDAILGPLLKRVDMTCNGLIGRKTPDDYLSIEWQQDKRFDVDGRKIEIENLEVAKERFIAQMTKIRARSNNYAVPGGLCQTCKQTLPEGWPNQSMAELVASGLVDPNELHAD